MSPAVVRTVEVMGGQPQDGLQVAGDDKDRKVQPGERAGSHGLVPAEERALGLLSDVSQRSVGDCYVVLEKAPAEIVEVDCSCLSASEHGVRRSEIAVQQTPVLCSMRECVEDFGDLGGRAVDDSKHVRRDPRPGIVDRRSNGIARYSLSIVMHTPEARRRVKRSAARWRLAKSEPIARAGGSLVDRRTRPSTLRNSRNCRGEEGDMSMQTVYRPPCSSRAVAPRATRGAALRARRLRTPAQLYYGIPLEPYEG